MRRLFAFAPLLLLLTLLLPRGGTPCYVTDGAARYYLRTEAVDAAEVLTALGLRCAPEDRITERRADGAWYLSIERLLRVTVQTPERTLWLQSYGETAGALLRRAGLSEDAGLRLCCDAQLPLSDGMTLRLVRRTVRLVRSEMRIPRRTLRLESPALAAGETVLLCDGADGVVQYTERLTEQDGAETGRECLLRVQLSAPRTRIELYGVDRTAILHPAAEEPAEPGGAAVTAEGGILETSSGELLRYRSVLQCDATADSCEGYTGVTATGTVARVGAIAVDPRYIPYGTRLYIVSNDGQYCYGYATAEDTGAFSGNRIDLYFDTIAECWQFGRRMCTVYVLE